MDIALLLTGNELMSGDTVDSNSSMIAQSLSPNGFSIACKSTVGDDLAFLVEELDRLSAKYSVLIVNGGLGPTVDDLTTQALAQLINLPLIKNAQAEEHLKSWCAKRKVELNEANLKQALLPQNAKVIDNPVGSAVGILLQHNGCLILCTPGVPSELRAMLGGHVLEILQQAFPNAKAKLIRRLKLFGVGESQLQQLIEDQITQWPSEVVLGFRAGLPLLELKLEIGNPENLALRDRCELNLREIVGDFIVGENDQTLAQILVTQLKAKQQRIALAESCTGGGIAAQITSVPTASQAFETGIVAYSNITKENVLGVDKKLLLEKGAVSQEVVLAMAEKVIKISNANYAIAVSGVAGPDGGTDEKPVGTVWIAWGERNNLMAHKFYYPSKRGVFQTIVVSIALDLMRRYLLGNTQIPNYYGRTKT